MRALVLVGLSLAVTSALAQPALVPAGHTADLGPPPIAPFQPRYAEPPSEAPILPQARDAPTPFGARGLSIGPFRLDSQSESTGRKQRHVARIRLDGVSFLGASIGGSVDGRGATVSLHWSN